MTSHEQSTDLPTGGCPFFIRRPKKGADAATLPRRSKSEDTGKGSVLSSTSKKGRLFNFFSSKSKKGGDDTTPPQRSKSEGTPQTDDFIPGIPSSQSTPGVASVKLEALCKDFEKIGAPSDPPIKPARSVYPHGATSNFPNGSNMTGNSLVVVIDKGTEPLPPKPARPPRKDRTSAQPPTLPAIILSPQSMTSSVTDDVCFSKGSVDNPELGDEQSMLQQQPILGRGSVSERVAVWGQQPRPLASASSQPLRKSCPVIMVQEPATERESDRSTHNHIRRCTFDAPIFLPPTGDVLVTGKEVFEEMQHDDLLEGIEILNVAVPFVPQVAAR